MLERADNVLRVTAPMLFGGARTLLEAGRRQLDGRVSAIDLSAVQDADSSALAVLFAWLRTAKKQQASLQIINPPAGLLSLAALYGVDDFLPLA